MNFIIVCTAALIPILNSVKLSVSPKGESMSKIWDMSDTLFSNGECKSLVHGSYVILFYCGTTEYRLPTSQCSVTYTNSK